MHLLELTNESLDQSVPLIDQTLESLIQLVLFEQVYRLVPRGRKLSNFGLLILDLRALPGNDLFQTEGVLWRALVLVLLDQVFQLLHTLH